MFCRALSDSSQVQLLDKLLLSGAFLMVPAKFNAYYTDSSFYSVMIPDSSSFGNKSASWTLIVHHECGSDEPTPYHHLQIFPMYCDIFCTPLLNSFHNAALHSILLPVNAVLSLSCTAAP